MQDPIVPLERDSAFLESQTSPVLIGFGVFLLVLINHAVFIECATVVHNRLTIPFLEHHRRFLSRCALYFAIFLLVCSHLVEISIWGGALVVAGLVSGFYEAAFFTGSTYTTLGYGKELLPGPWGTITVMIALSGMFCIAWTTSSLIGMISSFHPSHMHSLKSSPPTEPKGP